MMKHQKTARRAHRGTRTASIPKVAPPNSGELLMKYIVLDQAPDLAQLLYPEEFEVIDANLERARTQLRNLLRESSKPAVQP